MRRGFLECLQEGVERLLGEHVHLIDDVDFESGGGWSVFDVITQFSNLLDAAVAGAVNLQDVERPPFRDLHAPLIVVAKIDRGPV